MSYVVLTDSCFWLGLTDTADQHHDAAISIAELIEGQQIILPWSCLYEIISTRLVRNRVRLLYLERLMKKPSVVLFDDTGYRQIALNEVFILNRLGFTYSLTDSVIREILKDINVRVNYLVTFNNKDFQDICQQRQVEILSFNLRCMIADNKPFAVYLFKQ